jgi:hypothetical protein
MPIAVSKSNSRLVILTAGLFAALAVPTGDAQSRSVPSDFRAVLIGGNWGENRRWFDDPPREYTEWLHSLQ